MVIVQQLFPILPTGYVAAPNVHLGRSFEIDVSTFEDQAAPIANSNGNSPAAPATETWAPPRPTLTCEAEEQNEDEYEVRVYDARRGRRLVAAIEIISPSNKDRPKHRTAFLDKVSALLHTDVCVSIVDVVSIRPFNLYAELLDRLGLTDPSLGDSPMPMYASTLRWLRPSERRSRLDTWFYPLEIGKTLPVLPIWLSTELVIPLELEPSYEETCRVLRIA
jgi:hypothetical protein